MYSRLGKNPHCFENTSRKEHRMGHRRKNLDHLALLSLSRSPKSENPGGTWNVFLWFVPGKTVGQWDLSRPISESVSSVPRLPGPTLHPPPSLKWYFTDTVWSNDYSDQRNIKAVGSTSACTGNSVISEGMEGKHKSLRYEVPILMLTVGLSMLSLRVTLSKRKIWDLKMWTDPGDTLVSTVPLHPFH